MINEARETEQFNMRVTEFPRAFYGKKRHKKFGSENFIPCNGKRRYTASALLMLCAVDRETKRYGSFNTMPYAAFENDLRISGVTVCRNLKTLIEDGKLKRNGQSRYEINADYTCENNYVPVYHFLFDEIDLGGTVKKLSKNAVLLACEVISFYLNEKNKGKYFIGGRQGISALMNFAESTAGDVIKELTDTRVFFIKEISEDSAGNIMLKNGKGNSRKKRTAYVVNTEILLRCKKIQKRIKEQRELKKIFKATQENSPEPQTTAKPEQRTGKTSERWTLAEYDFNELEARFASDEMYINLKNRYLALKDDLFKALRCGDYDMADEIEAEQYDLIDDIRAYLIQNGTPPDKLPNNLNEYIK